MIFHVYSTARGIWHHQPLMTPGSRWSAVAVAAGFWNVVAGHGLQVGSPAMAPTPISRGTRLCSSRHVSKNWLLGCAPQMCASGVDVEISIRAKLCAQESCHLVGLGGSCKRSLGCSPKQSQLLIGKGQPEVSHTRSRTPNKSRHKGIPFPCFYIP